MPTLHIFNPSHDEALAAATPYYTPSKAARLLAHDLAALPALWAEAGDYVLLPRADHALPAFAAARGIVGITPEALAALPAGGIAHIAPWGWDALLVARLQRLGIAPQLLPSVEQLAQWRTGSGRATAVDALKGMRAACEGTIGESYIYNVYSNAAERCKQWGGAVWKAPWSCSGRGVFLTGGVPSPAERARIEHILARQGTIVVEPHYNKVHDFALLFTLTAGEAARYEGLSCFSTQGGSAYNGNLVASEAALHECLPAALHGAIGCARRELLRDLPQRFPTYSGAVGVDMMSVIATDGTLRLHPLVEINLRRTMGFAALAARRLLKRGETARFVIRPRNDHATTPSALYHLTPSGTNMEAVLLRAETTS